MKLFFDISEVKSWIYILHDRSNDIEALVAHFRDNPSLMKAFHIKHRERNEELKEYFKKAALNCIKIYDIFIILYLQYGNRFFLLFVWTQNRNGNFTLDRCSCVESKMSHNIQMIHNCNFMQSIKSLLFEYIYLKSSNYSINCILIRIIKNTSYCSAAYWSTITKLENEKNRLKWSASRRRKMKKKRKIVGARRRE